MNVQLILVQAGIELAREVIRAPVTKRLLVKAISKLSDGSLCPLNFDFEKGTWKMYGGEYPSLMIQATDPDGDETTLTCSVEFARIIAKGFMQVLEALDLSRNHQLFLFASDHDDLGYALNSRAHSFDTPLEELIDFEDFVNYEFFGADQTS